LPAGLIADTSFSTWDNSTRVIDYGALSAKPISARQPPPHSQARAARNRRHPTYTFGFLDETGTLGGERDPFFAVGLTLSTAPHQLQRAFQRIRDRRHFYDEIKWKSVSAKKLPVLEELVDVFLASYATFSAFVTDKAKHDVISRFGDQFKA